MPTLEEFSLLVQSTGYGQRKGCQYVVGMEVGTEKSKLHFHVGLYILSGTFVIDHKKICDAMKLTIDNTLWTPHIGNTDNKIEGPWYKWYNYCTKGGAL